ncbi:MULTISPECIES: S-layer homology domain-containing protein [Paenibacillus]|uniref:S-layer homology domain-containing protein n=1 Tax=Paenibacillus TaxID=44249 RepID=UPI001BCB4D65
MNIPNEEKGINVFKDASSIAFWSKGAIGAAASQKIIIGYSDHNFKPEQRPL